ncbi:class I SAM-dependent methyltransferase [Marilutibacter spongiae]|uniref:Class I SAM-dependent methyltransferase n=1 Tax=Marilutibacter spongiae TaxID=2025720 RepID=A0A7W3Y4S4_9GAMM|nr:class I SAM-dependent methyltransferase [Lysobacter spongiae]MBB1059131.1 class I SAM-dependent methyltransferase [Lysobacter spongiae]
MTVRSEAPGAPKGLEFVEACPVCGGGQLEERYRELVDLEEGVPGSWSMSACRRCGSLLLNPRLDAAHISSAYTSYYTHASPEYENRLLSADDALSSVARSYLQGRFASPGAKGRSATARLFGLAWPLRQQADYFMRHLPPVAGSLLDVGCGGGGFLVRARAFGWDVQGVEPDPVAAAVASEVSGATVVPSLDALDGRLFDRVTLSHVVEHAHEPMALIEDCVRRLRPGGTLWLATPNIHGIGHRVFGRHWQALETPRHLAMPSAPALAQLLERAGLVDVRFVRRGRGAGKRIRASATRTGARRWTVLAPLLACVVDVLASLAPRAAEELVVVGRKPGP